MRKYYFLKILILVLIILLPTIALAQPTTDPIPLADSVRSPVIMNAWRLMIGIMNMAAILGLIFIALANILKIQIDVYHVRRMLPALIFGIILANFSHLFCRIFIDFAQTLMVFFKEGFGAAEINYITLGKTVGIYGPEATITTPTVMNAAAVWTILLVFVFNVVPVLLTLAVLAIIIFGLPVFLILILSLLMYARVYVVWILVIVSPLALFCLFFAPLQVLFSKWWNWFLKWVFLGPVIMFILKIAVEIGDYSTEILGNIAETGDEASTINMISITRIGQWIFGLIFIALAIIVPFAIAGPVGAFIKGLLAKALSPIAGYGKVKALDSWAIGKRNLRNMPGIGHAMRWGEKGRASAGAARMEEEEQMKEEMKDAFQKRIYSEGAMMDRSLDKVREGDISNTAGMLKSKMTAEQLEAYGLLNKYRQRPDGLIEDESGNLITNPLDNRRYHIAVSALEEKSRDMTQPEEERKGAQDALNRSGNPKNIFDVHKALPGLVPFPSKGVLRAPETQALVSINQKLRNGVALTADERVTLAQSHSARRALREDIAKEEKRIEGEIQKRMNLAPEVAAKIKVLFDSELSDSQVAAKIKGERPDVEAIVAQNSRGRSNLGAEISHFRSQMNNLREGQRIVDNANHPGSPAEQFRHRSGYVAEKLAHDVHTLTSGMSEDQLTTAWSAPGGGIREKINKEANDILSTSSTWGPQRGTPAYQQQLDQLSQNLFNAIRAQKRQLSGGDSSVPIEEFDINKYSSIARKRFERL